MKLLDIIKDENLKGLITDILELELDNVIDNESIKDIPIIGSVFKLYGVSKKISDYFLLKKIGKFLSGLEDIEEELKNKFLMKDNKVLSEKLLIVLNQLNSEIKAELIGNLFKAYIEEKLSKDQLLEIIDAVEIIFINDLLISAPLPTYMRNGYLGEIPLNTIMRLQSVGFITKIEQRVLGGSDINYTDTFNRYEYSNSFRSLGIYCNETLLKYKSGLQNN
ncbi:hypothetical protein [Sphingobacterium sp. BIGb0165]|uniref:hypothetical protein n=1 Tax=Sphingobacterium sp. BIGb0165 TaxID=2940615 RepID=UPI00216814AE|nr:hypothetical protein [Sphingobacterium sp. BIGb0165]MCS4226423.1 hypothetical protein [Sphingobacterium sp. BIGb0165]